MRLLHSSEDLTSISGPIVLAIGVFDGLHLGHQAVLRAALSAAKSLNGTAIALTFDPHPARILRPGHAPRLLTSTAHKLRLMDEFGIENALIIPFDNTFASLEPEDFIARLCAATSSLAQICIGHGWRFGRARRGDGALLRSLGEKYRFTTIEVPSVSVDGITVSSTRIRKAIEAGDLGLAGKLLGRDYSIFGTVQRGESLGRQIGFPTANLAAHNEQFPPNGVYAVHVKITDRLWHGVANIGLRPTVSSIGTRVLEVHILNFHEDLYYRDIEVFFLSFLRPEKKFPNLDALRSQIATDVESARQLLASKDS